MEEQKHDDWKYYKIKNTNKKSKTGQESNIIKLVRNKFSEKLWSKWRNTDE